MFSSPYVDALAIIALFSDFKFLYVVTVRCQTNIIFKYIKRWISTKYWKLLKVGAKLD